MNFKTWSRRIIGDVCDPVEMVIPQDNPDHEFTYVDISSIDNTKQCIASPKKCFGRNAPSRARQKVKTGDTLFSTVRTYLKNIAMVTEEFHNQIASTGFCVLRPSQAVDPRFFFYFVQTDQFLEDMARLQRGSSYPAVRDKDILSHPIEIPPLVEQRRIIAEIEKQFSRLDVGATVLRRAKANLKRYKASVLKAACEGRLVPQDPNDEPADHLLEHIIQDRRSKSNRHSKYPKPVSIDETNLPKLPGRWCWTTLGVVTEGQQYGTSAKTSVVGDVPVIRMGNIQDGQLYLENLKYLPMDHPDIDRMILEPGDLLFNRTNSPELVGKSAVYMGTPSPCSFASYLIRVRTNPLWASAAFLACYINSSHGRRYINSVKSQQVGQANVNGTKLSAMPVPLPPLAEQQRIVAEVERRLSISQTLEALVEANLKRAERLRQAILKRAFEGKLVPQDPNDEPASVLLERILAERAKQEIRRAKPRGFHRSRQTRMPATAGRR